MSVLNYLSRVIKNPRFILSENFILHPFTSLSTVKRIIQSNNSIIQSAQKLTGERPEVLTRYYDDISNNVELHKHINKQFDEFEKSLLKKNLKNLKFSKENPAGRLNRKSQDNAGFLLYILVRALKPEVVIETGVSSGESSAFILQGLHDNQKGNLYSIDLPPKIDQNQREIIFPDGKSSGWIIPDYLRSRWHISLGSSKELLLPLLEKLKKIDMFWHDSLHTYEHMLFEYKTSWDFIRDGGILFSDDIATLNNKGRSPLVDFAYMKEREITVFRLMGGMRK